MLLKFQKRIMKNFQILKISTKSTKSWENFVLLANKRLVCQLSELKLILLSVKSTKTLTSTQLFTFYIFFSFYICMILMILMILMIPKILMLFLNPLNPFNFRETVLTLPPSFECSKFSTFCKMNYFIHLRHSLEFISLL